MAASYDFSGKVVIVTGASSGLGQATAVLLAKVGASVVLCGRDEGRLSTSLEQCATASGGHTERFVTVAGNIQEPEVRDAIVTKAASTFGHLDVLVANAGVGIPKGDIDEATEEVFDEIFNINVKSTFFLIQACLPHLKESKGNIVIVSSASSTMSLGNSVLYPVSKAAVDHMTRCLSVDLGPYSVRINSVNPSFVPTRITRSYDVHGKIHDINQLVKVHEDKMQPLRGECISADDVANNIAFLASDAARSITGQNHFVDGGRHFLGPGSLAQKFSQTQDRIK